ncbi:MAG: hypothetical protein F6J87_29130 [Spirulina sp. SIO3F2]|nr:hypothetical protein [Spirulina sp. SIO3F2]
MSNKESVQQKLKSLWEIDLQNEAGLKTLIAALDDSVLEIRAQAYWILRDWRQKVIDDYVILKPDDPIEWKEIVTQQAFEHYANRHNINLEIFDIVDVYTRRGVKVNPGEIVYCVYASALTYGDDFYHLHDQLDPEDHLFPDDYNDSDNEYYNPSFEYACLTLDVAEHVAHQLHNKIALKLYSEGSGTMLFMIDGSTSGLPKDFNLEQWCSEQNLSLQDIAGNSGYGYSGSYFQDWKRITTIEKYLYDNRQHELLGQLWLGLIGKLAFVHKLTIQKTRYLPIVEVF